jgi:hypothetical protein
VALRERAASEASLVFAERARARAVEGDNALGYQILFWIPCLSLIALLILSSRTNRIMKQNGIKVGFLGVDPANIP